MDLGTCNQRLRDHFSALARDRKDIPVFALEHDLAQAELLALESALRAHIRVAPPERNHQIAWVVYAAEIGYGYAGDEYWQTFESETPGWKSNGRREWIRDAFFSFQRQFSGAKPSGPWAEHFSIIAWPITHAILPRDLQQQLAWVLYNYRHWFSAELFEEPQRLGEFIAGWSWGTSARFQNLVQAPALVGQIASALLLQAEEGFKPLLYPATLKRISEDVDRERRGREWLRSAREAAEQRVRTRGFAIGRTNATFERRDEAHAEVIRLGIEPRLLLRPLEGSRFEVLLEIPDLSNLMFHFPQVRDVLAESRCTVSGAVGRPLARGRCLHGSQRVVLADWPRPDDVLLKFEQSDPQLEFLLRAECMLRPGTSWLFRVASDGLAYESRGLRVRAGSKYVLVRTEPFTCPPVGSSVELTCEGVHALLLETPAAITPDWERALKELQLGQAKLVEVWPAGLSAVAWDGEGHGEWLSSETPILGFRCDHVVDELTIAQSDGPSLSISLSDTPPGEPIFVEVPSLPVGIHNLSFAARCSNGAHSDLVGDLEIIMRIREPRPWSPSSILRGPLELRLDPAAPTLEQLWEGKASIEICGPDGRQTNCKVRFCARPGDVPLLERELPPLTMPLSSEEWARHFEIYFKKDDKHANVYDESRILEIDFLADELGRFTIRCEREFTPLRWTIRREAAGFIACLHDDAGREDPSVHRFSFERPTIGERLLTTPEHPVPRSGGLYVAGVSDLRASASIIVPPIVHDLSDLGCEPRLNAPSPTVEHIPELVRFVQLWSAAKLPGNVIAELRRRKVVGFLMAHLWALIGGDRWGRKEDEFSREVIGIGGLRLAVSSIRSPNGSERPPTDIFPRELLTELQTAPLSHRCAALVDLIERRRLMPYSARSRPIAPSLHPVKSNGDASTAKLAEFALRIASDPATLTLWADGEFNRGIESLLKAPTLARAARFLVLAIDNQLHSAVQPGEIYAGWRWSA